MRQAVLLMGPTGAGKSDLALELVARFPLEIVSVDSALVYRGMDIGTAKPAAATRARIAHHLIDIREPTMAYSAGEFVRDAALAMEDIWSRGRAPLLVGGTMLYFQALTRGIAALPQAEPAVRAQIEAEAVTRGWEALHADLARIDPASARRIHPRDPQRIQRALEVFRVTGQTITELREARVVQFAAHRCAEFALVPGERRSLHARLDARFDAMLEAGLLEEVRGLFGRAELSGEHPAMRAVGYRQLWEYLGGHGSLEEARRKAVAATRQLAKRQMTWLRQRPDATCVDCLDRNVAGFLIDALARGLFAEWSCV
jgi:tRNA dimethylallyltransferase